MTKSCNGVKCKKLYLSYGRINEPKYQNKFRSITANLANWFDRRSSFGLVLRYAHSLLTVTTILYSTLLVDKHF